MRRTQRALFFGLIVVQVLVMVGMAAGRELTLRDDSRDVTLQTRPVDPRDLFRGDYAILRYEISTIDRSEVRVPAQVRDGDTVYVELVEDGGGTWSARSVALEPADGWRRFIRGSVEREGGSAVQIDYGIEAFFVPEGRGGEVQFADDVKVVVALDTTGGAVIRHVIVDGERWER